MRQRGVCLTFAIPCITLKEIREATGDKLKTEMEYKYSNSTRLPLVSQSLSGKRKKIAGDHRKLTKLRKYRQTEGNQFAYPVLSNIENSYTLFHVHLEFQSFQRFCLFSAILNSHLLLSNSIFSMYSVNHLKYVQPFFILFSYFSRILVREQPTRLFHFAFGFRVVFVFAFLLHGTTRE